MFNVLHGLYIREDYVTYHTIEITVDHDGRSTPEIYIFLPPITDLQTVPHDHFHGNTPSTKVHFDNGD